MNWSRARETTGGSASYIIKLRTYFFPQYWSLSLDWSTRSYSVVASFTNPFNNIFLCIGIIEDQVYRPTLRIYIRVLKSRNRALHLFDWNEHILKSKTHDKNSFVKEHLQSKKRQRHRTFVRIENFVSFTIVNRIIICTHIIS